MAFVAVDKNGEEWVYQLKPERDDSISAWKQSMAWTDICMIPSGSIKKLIGRDLSWNDEPVELT